MELSYDRSGSHNERPDATLKRGQARGPQRGSPAGVEAALPNLRTGRDRVLLFGSLSFQTVSSAFSPVISKPELTSNRVLTFCWHEDREKTVENSSRNH